MTLTMRDFWRWAIHNCTTTHFISSYRLERRVLTQCPSKAHTHLHQPANQAKPQNESAKSMGWRVYCHGHTQFECTQTNQDISCASQISWTSLSHSSDEWPLHSHPKGFKGGHYRWHWRGFQCDGVVKPAVQPRCSIQKHTGIYEKMANQGQTHTAFPEVYAGRVDTVVWCGW